MPFARFRATPPPVDATGMGPTAVELCGRFADGWHALMLTRDGLRERMSALERGADLGDRSIDDVRVTRTVTCAALSDRDRARELVAGHVAFYVAAMGDFYRQALASQGYAETAEAVTEAWQDGDTDAAAERIAEDVLNDVAVADEPAAAREQLESLAAVDGVDAVSVSFPREATQDEVAETMKALAPEDV